MAGSMIRVTLTGPQARVIHNLLQAARDGGPGEVARHMATLKAYDYKALAAGHDRLAAAMQPPPPPPGSQETAT